jgi:hypothetical protein
MAEQYRKRQQLSNGASWNLIRAAVMLWQGDKGQSIIKFSADNQAASES